MADACEEQIYDAAQLQDLQPFRKHSEQLKIGTNVSGDLHIPLRPVIGVVCMANPLKTRATLPVSCRICVLRDTTKTPVLRDIMKNSAWTKENMADAGVDHKAAQLYHVHLGQD